MKKFLVTLSILLASGLLVAQVVISPPASSGGGGSGTISTGAVNDVPCYSAATTVGPCDTGVLTDVGSTHVLSNTNILATGHFGDGVNYLLRWDASNSGPSFRNLGDTVGVPLTVKDLYTDDIRTSNGCSLQPNNNRFWAFEADSNCWTATNQIFRIGSDKMIGWNSATDLNTGALDATFTRNAIGIIEVNNGTPCSTQSNCRDLLVRNLLSTNGTAKLTISSSQATNQTLTVPAIRQSETVAIKPQSSLTSVASPAGTSTTASFVMMGLGANITPQVTGRVMVAMSGNFLNTTLADGCNAKIAWGTGTNPTNGAAASGTVIGSTKSYTAAVASAKAGAAFNALLTGAVINTQIWIDLQFEAVTGGTCTFGNMDVTAFEY